MEAGEITDLVLFGRGRVREPDIVHLRGHNLALPPDLEQLFLQLLLLAVGLADPRVEVDVVLDRICLWRC